jgi:hypothetical protein
MTVVIICLSIIVVVLAITLLRAAKRLLEFDEFFSMLVDDIDLNIDYLSKLSSTPTFSDAPEVVDAHKKMRIISKRLDEFVLRMEELARKEIRKKRINPPVVI